MERKLTPAQRLGLTLLDWHSGGGSGVYAAGSSLFAGHIPDDETLRRAIDELNRPFDGAHPECVTSRDVQQQSALAVRLERLRQRLARQR